MDFLSQYNSFNFQRKTIRFTKTSGQSVVGNTPTTDMGGAFILLDATAAGAECRLRLYSDSASRSADENRAAGNFNLSQSVALITDIVFTTAEKITFNPPIIGNTFNNGELWYNLSASSAPNVTVDVNFYQIKPLNNSVDGNTILRVSGSSIPTTGDGISGSITTSKSFIILSGSATSESRLRLYSRPIDEISSVEKTRPFESQSQSGSRLIVDLMFDSGSFQYPLVPVVEGFTYTNENYVVGTNQVGYILHNRSAGITNITASLYIYSLED